MKRRQSTWIKVFLMLSNLLDIRTSNEPTNNNPARFPMNQNNIHIQRTNIADSSHTTMINNPQYTTMNNIPDTLSDLNLFGKTIIISGPYKVMTSSVVIITGDSTIITGYNTIIHGNDRIVDGNTVITGNSTIMYDNITVTGNSTVITGNKTILTGDTIIIPRTLQDTAEMSYNRIIRGSGLVIDLNHTVTTGNTSVTQENTLYSERNMLYDGENTLYNQNTSSAINNGENILYSESMLYNQNMSSAINNSENTLYGENTSSAINNGENVLYSENMLYSENTNNLDNQDTVIPGDNNLQDENIPSVILNTPVSNITRKSTNYNGTGNPNDLYTNVFTESENMAGRSDKDASIYSWIYNLHNEKRVPEDIPKSSESTSPNNTSLNTAEHSSHFEYTPDLVMNSIEDSSETSSSADIYSSFIKSMTPEQRKVFHEAIDRLVSDIDSDVPMSQTDDVINEVFEINENNDIIDQDEQKTSDNENIIVISEDGSVITDNTEVGEVEGHTPEYKSSEESVEIIEAMAVPSIENNRKKIEVNLFNYRSIGYPDENKFTNAHYHHLRKSSGFHSRKDKKDIISSLMKERANIWDLLFHVPTACKVSRFMVLYRLSHPSNADAVNNYLKSYDLTAYSGVFVDLHQYIAQTISTNHLHRGWNCSPQVIRVERAQDAEMLTEDTEGAEILTDDVDMESIDGAKAKLINTWKIIKKRQKCAKNFREPIRTRRSIKNSEDESAVEETIKKRQKRTKNLEEPIKKRRSIKSSEELEVSFPTKLNNSQKTERNNSACSKNTKDNISSGTETEIETLYDIYMRRSLNAFWYANSLEIMNSSKKCLERSKCVDIVLQENISLILALPEIYQDLYNISKDAIDAAKEQFAKKNIKAESNLVIVEYLMHKVQTNTIGMEATYEKVKKIHIHGVSIMKLNRQLIYNVVYNAFMLFYANSGYLQRLRVERFEKELEGIDEQKKQKFFSSNCYNFRSPDKKKVSILLGALGDRKLENSGNSYYSLTYKLLGKNAIVSQKYLICEYWFRLQSAAKNKCSTKPKIDRVKVVYKDHVLSRAEITHAKHYHVQIVDNFLHRVETIHLPFYVHKSGETTELIPVHTVACIIAHLKKVFKITNEKVHGGIYPFKYNRKKETWSMVTGTTVPNTNPASDMLKTVEELNQEGFDIIFYHIQNIHAENLTFAVFLGPGEKSGRDSLKTRIPLFLPQLMVSAAPLGPYSANFDLSRRNFVSGFSNLKPVEFIHINDRFAEYTHSSCSLMKNYYSDFMVQNIHGPFEDNECFAMGIRQYEVNEKKFIRWETKQQNSSEEYSSYMFSFKANASQADNSKRETVERFLKVIQGKHALLDMVYYGVSVQMLSEKESKESGLIMCKTLRDFLKDRIKVVFSPYPSEIIKLLNNSPVLHCPDANSGVITIKTVNHTMSKLGLHLGIWNIFLQNCRAMPSQNME
ncbi:hypothetical protein NEAUS07_1579 [Nematocida ausubeli]|nr:hypothetical protein NEAUS07_1579 [Nematocida ausubeli]